MMSLRRTVVSILAILHSLTVINGFGVTPFLHKDLKFGTTSTCTFMGKSSVTPGPAGKATSGKATSDYRSKKMKKRLGKKNKGGFTKAEDVEIDSKGKVRPVLDIELKPEPETGTDVAVLASIGADNVRSDGFVVRLKDLGEVDSDDEAYDLEEEIGAKAHNFWLSAIAEGEEIQKFRMALEKDATKNANFPGFRPGQIPPYAQPKMTNFALQEGIVKTCQAAILRYGVKEINIDAIGAVTFNEDIEQMSSKYNYKSCPSVPFTANFRAIFDPEVAEDNAASLAAEAASDDSETEIEKDDEATSETIDDKEA